MSNRRPGCNFISEKDLNDGTKKKHLKKCVLDNRDSNEVSTCSVGKVTTKGVRCTAAENITMFLQKSSIFNLIIFIFIIIFTIYDALNLLLHCSY